MKNDLEDRSARQVASASKHGFVKRIVLSGVALLVVISGAQVSVAQGNGIPHLSLATVEVLPKQPDCYSVWLSMNTPSQWQVDSRDQESFSLHGPFASVSFACEEATNGFKRFVIIAGSTDALTGGWFLEDFKIRIQQVAAGKPVTGNPLPPVLGGRFVNLQIDHFTLHDRLGSVMENGLNALSRTGFRITSQTGTFAEASNANASVIVSVSSEDPLRQRITVAASAADSAATRAACDSVRHTMETTVRID